MALLLKLFFWTLLLLPLGCGSKTAPESEAGPTTFSQLKPSRMPEQQRLSSALAEVDDDLERIPRQTELRCAAKDCPPQVGLLLFIIGNNIKRCTATLIAEDQIITTGHCDFFPQPGYFLLGRGEAKQYRRIESRLYKRLTPTKDGSEARAPAVAVYRLESAIEGVAPMPVATKSSAFPKARQLIGYVVNADGDYHHYRIDLVRCTVRRHESLFPYDLNESPDLIYGFDCPLARGNSGPPFLAPGHPELQAVFQGLVDPADIEKEKRSQGRGLLPLEAHWIMTSTTVRCLQWPGHPAASDCTRVTDEESNRRFFAAQQAAYGAISKREAPGADSSPVAYKPYSFELKPSSAAAVDKHFEVLYWPSCQWANEDLQGFAIPSEWLQMSYDAWAVPTFKSLSSRQSPVSIVSWYGKTATLQVQWAQAFGAMLNPDQDPRAQFGSRFPIDLPQCSR